MAEKDLAAEALLEFLNAVEAGVASAKRMIADAKGVGASQPPQKQESDKASPETLAEYDTLDWQTVHGTKGDYEQVRRSPTKIEVFDKLAEDLKAHANFVKRGGYQYWFHRDDKTVVDRRRK
jgi:hypothetical protein